MDTLVHGVIGAALCSRTGLAGGRRGPPRTEKQGWPFSDWTLGAAFFFGMLPDLVSLGIHFAMDLFAGNGMQWHGIPDFIFVLYDITHSLAGMAVCIGLLVWWKRSLGLPILAWPLHVLTDVPTHGGGRFMTPILWPFSEAGWAGWNWWEHPWMFYGSWIFAGGLWLVVLGLRLSWRKT
jgi:hypothetical protein